jgi:hypothetical protein
MLADAEVKAVIDSICVFEPSKQVPVGLVSQAIEDKTHKQCNSWQVGSVVAKSYPGIRSGPGTDKRKRGTQKILYGMDLCPIPPTQATAQPIQILTPTPQVDVVKPSAYGNHPLVMGLNERLKIKPRTVVSYLLDTLWSEVTPDAQETYLNQLTERIKVFLAAKKKHQNLNKNAGRIAERIYHYKALNRDTALFRDQAVRNMNSNIVAAHIVHQKFQPPGTPEPDTPPLLPAGASTEQILSTLLAYDGHPTNGTGPQRKPLDDRQTFAFGGDTATHVHNLVNFDQAAKRTKVKIPADVELPPPRQPETHYLPEIPNLPEGLPIQKYAWSAYIPISKNPNQTVWVTMVEGFAADFKKDPTQEKLRDWQQLVKNDVVRLIGEEIHKQEKRRILRKKPKSRKQVNNEKRLCRLQEIEDTAIQILVHMGIHINSPLGQTGVIPIDPQHNPGQIAKSLDVIVLNPRPTTPPKVQVQIAPQPQQSQQPQPQPQQQVSAPALQPQKRDPPTSLRLNQLAKLEAARYGWDDIWPVSSYPSQTIWKRVVTNLEGPNEMYRAWQWLFSKDLHRAVKRELERNHLPSDRREHAEKRLKEFQEMTEFIADELAEDNQPTQNITQTTYPIDADTWNLNEPDITATDQMPKITAEDRLAIDAKKNEWTLWAKPRYIYFSEILTQESSGNNTYLQLIVILMAMDRKYMLYGIDKPVILNA